MIWLSCDGEFEHNRKNMGKIHYYPHQGFNGTEFQCANNGDCNDPILALKFEGILSMKIEHLLKVSFRHHQIVC